MRESVVNLAAIRNEKLQGASDAAASATSARVIPLADETFDRKVYSLLGVPMDTLTMAETTTAIDRTINAGGKMWLGTPNLDWFTMGKTDDAFRRSMIAADLSVCDGMPVLMLAKLAGIPLQTRVQGSSLFDRLRQVKPSFRGSRSVFFFGGRDGAAEQAADVLKKEDGGVTSIGSFNPGFGTVEEMSTEEITEEVSAGNPDLLLVSLSAYKGQLWIEKNIDKISARIIAPLGAVVDFTAGTVQRAPKLFQKTGMEWLWRIKEDRQLAKRYAKNFASLPGFALRCLKSRRMIEKMAASAPENSGTSTVAMENGLTTITLAADCRETNLASTRASLKKAVAAGHDVHIDFSNCVSFDLGLLGLLQLADHRLSKADIAFTIGNTSKTAQKLLKLNDCRFETKETIMAAKPAVDAAPIAAST